MWRSCFALVSDSDSNLKLTSIQSNVHGLSLIINALANSPLNTGDRVCVVVLSAPSTNICEPKKKLKGELVSTCGPNHFFRSSNVQAQAWVANENSASCIMVLSWQERLPSKLLCWTISEIQVAGSTFHYFNKVGYELHSCTIYYITIPHRTSFCLDHGFSKAMWNLLEWSVLQWFLNWELKVTREVLCGITVNGPKHGVMELW